MTTQFGELPLHLAVECGAAPEVVNLIMVANWEAIVTPDTSGRIPTDLLDRGELLLLDDHRIVHESLMRCHKAYTDMQQRGQDEQAALKRKLKAQLTTIHKQHQEALKSERQKQEEIQKQVTDLQAQIEDLKDVQLAKDKLVEECQRETQMWKERIETLTATIELLQEELVNEKDKIEELEDELDEREEQVANRDNLIALLSNDLREVSISHENDIMASVRAAEQSMRAMVSSQIALQKQLTGQAGNLRTLLTARGIDPSPVSEGLQQEEKDSNSDGPVDENDAATALAAAAMAALQK